MTETPASDSARADAPAAGNDSPADPHAEYEADHEHTLYGDMEVVNLADVSADEVISRSIVVLMSAAAEKLGLADEDPSSSKSLDLDEARKLVTSLAGLVDASAEWLGPKASAVRDGLQGLQRAFRESSAYPDEPGKGPGEKYTGPLY